MSRTKLIFLSAWIVVSLTACEHHRQVVREEQQQLAHSAEAVRTCVVKFVLETDSPRLTGFELVEAGASACGNWTLKLRQLMDDQGYEKKEVDALVNATIKEAQQDALAALAAHDQKNPPPPRRTVADPIS
jgi:hypothetical protein